MGKKLFVKSERSFRIDESKIISGGRQDDKGKFTGYLDPETVVELEADEAQKLKAMYPREFIEMDQTAAPSAPKPKAKTKEADSFEAGDKKS